MKKILSTITIIAFFLAAPLFMMAQNPPHPNGGAVPNSGSNTPVGGGAPIDGGISIMLLLGAAYGGKKIYQMKK